MSLSTRKGLTVLVPILVGSLHGQPVFEVASIKASPNAPISAAVRKRSGGRITWTAPRISLVAYAYNVPLTQISGLGIDTVPFAVEAEATPTATDDEVRRTFQTLLAERFHLTVHREAKEQKVLFLIAKNDTKLTRSSTTAEGTLVMLQPNPMKWVGKGVTMAKLALALSNPTGVVVIDKTGLTGRYDIKLTYLPDGPSDSDEVGPSLYAALEQQLGLRLEKGTAPVEHLVVDHMDKTPREN